MGTFHAHIDIQSQDCDGRISRSYVASYANAEEALDLHRPTSESYTIVRSGDWICIREVTEEGHRSTELTFCEEHGCDEIKSTYRDHRAEEAGY